jgi:ATP-dependent RNA helicase RhlE
VHRIGRTGRAGAEGEALSLCGRADRGLVQKILQHLDRSSDGRARVVVDGKEPAAPRREPESRREREPRREREKPARREEPRSREHRNGAPQSNGAAHPPANDNRRKLAASAAVALKASDRAARDDASDVVFGGERAPARGG